MRLMKPRNFMVFGCALLSGVALLYTSQNVQKAENQLRALHASTQRENEKIRLLKAEWENLNRPERLERLARDFLDLVPPAPDRMVQNVSAVPEPSLEEEEGVSVSQAVSFSPSPVYGPPAVVSSPVIQSVESKPEAKTEKDFGSLVQELGEAPQ